MRSNTKLWLLLVLGCIPLLVLCFLFNDSPYLFFIGTLELLAIALIVNTFVIVYSRRNWKANPYGRALMYSKISLALLADLSLLTSYLGPDWEYRGVVRIFLFGFILFAQGRLLYLLFDLRKLETRPEYDRGKPKEVTEQ